LAGKLKTLKSLKCTKNKKIIKCTKKNKIIKCTKEGKRIKFTKFKNAPKIPNLPTYSLQHDPALFHAIYKSGPEEFK